MRVIRVQPAKHFNMNENTVLEETKLQERTLYLKDLTESCELKARKWHQRSQIRAGEVGALTEAIDVTKTSLKRGLVYLVPFNGRYMH